MCIVHLKLKSYTSFIVRAPLIYVILTLKKTFKILD